MATETNPPPSTRPPHQEKSTTTAEPTHEAPASRDQARRIEALEKAVADNNKSYIDVLKWAIAIIFPILTVFLAGLGIMTRYDATQSIKEATTKVDKAITEMDKRFAALAGEALKKPIIELLHDGRPLAGSAVELHWDYNVTPYDEATLTTLFLKNVGERRTEPLSINLAVAYPFKLVPNPRYQSRQDWEQTTSFEKDYVTSFSSTRHTTLAPGETLNIHPIVLEGDNTDVKTNIPCRILIFYGGERPAEARFSFAPNKRP